MSAKIRHKDRKRVMNTYLTKVCGDFYPAVFFQKALEKAVNADECGEMLGSRFTKEEYRTLYKFLFDNKDVHFSKKDQKDFLDKPEYK